MKRYITAFIIITMTGIVCVEARAQKTRVTTAATAVAQQPLYTDFRGVKLGMTPAEVRAKLGNPVLKDEEMDYYVFSDTVTAQVAYDAAHTVKLISVDYAGGAGAPEFRSVIAGELKTKEDGSAYAIVRYESSGFWVSYSRTAPPLSIVTVTISTNL
jgi:hypothetical protein